MGLLRWEYKITFALLGICSLATLLVFSEWMYGLNQRDDLFSEISQLQPSEYEVDPLPEYTFLQHPVEFYSESVNRPLFVEGRTPIEGGEEEQQVAVEEPTQPFQLTLIGSMDTPYDGLVALFKDPSAKESQDRFLRYAIGEDHFGWMIKSIKPDKVVIISGANEQEILLMKASPKKQKRVPARRKPATKKTPPSAFNKQKKQKKQKKK